MFDFFTDAFGAMNTYFWCISFVFIVGLGIIFTVKLKGEQILRIRETARLALSDAGAGKNSSKVSSFEAFCLSMGARIGVGNIAGVATAIATGGPGAVFWMWIFAIIGIVMAVINGVSRISSGVTFTGILSVLLNIALNVMIYFAANTIKTAYESGQA
jgi:Na+/alanine symporter